jgi:hypothetical protein
MKPQKDSFQDRVGRAAEAKQKALDQLKAKPPVDEAVLARRAAERSARDAAKAEALAAKRQQAEQAAADRAADERAAAEAAAASVTSESDRKAARDARYAARKNRK